MKRILICLLLAVIMMSSCSPHSSQYDAPETNDTTQSSAENEETTTDSPIIDYGPPLITAEKYEEYIATVETLPNAFVHQSVLAPIIGKLVEFVYWEVNLDYYEYVFMDAAEEYVAVMVTPWEGEFNTDRTVYTLAEIWDSLGSQPKNLRYSEELGLISNCCLMYDGIAYYYKGGLECIQWQAGECLITIYWNYGSQHPEADTFLGRLLNADTAIATRDTFNEAFLAALNETE